METRSDRVEAATLVAADRLRGRETRPAAGLDQAPHGFRAHLAREVHAERFIERLPDGYKTELRERGAGLSVGQKQLISFARALAHDPRVLILDEATSSIDTETEILIRDAVERLMQGRTSLVIAHRLSTIQSVDKIIVMHKGEIREVGSHQDLLAERGLYWRLYQLQFYQDFKRTFAESLAED